MFHEVWYTKKIKRIKQIVRSFLLDYYDRCLQLKCETERAKSMTSNSSLPAQPPKKLELTATFGKIPKKSPE